MSAAIRALVVGAGADNVATAVTALAVGERLELDGHVVEVREPIPSGHKLALRAIASGQLVVKYREPIGHAVADIAPGAHVHVHNVVSARLPGPDGRVRDAG